jgi:uncharacterized membrane protein
MILAVRNRPNAITVVVALFKKLNIPVTRSSLQTTLENHPDYPSLLSIHDTLQDFKLGTSAVLADKDQLFNLPRPFIGHIDEQQGGAFALVYHVDEHHVHYFNGHGNKKEIKEPIDAFRERWSGNSILVEKTPAAGELHYAKARREELLASSRVPAIFIVLLVAAVLAIFTATGSLVLPFATMLVLCLLGLLTCSLLIVYEVDKSNTLVQKICTASERTNCGAVLHSKGAQIMGIPWSLIGLSYFGSTTLLLSLAGTVALPIISVSSLLVAPYIIYSIYYQWRVVKQWCTLCLMVQAVLVLLALVSIFLLSPFHWTLITYQASPAMLILAVLLPVAISWLYYPKLIEASKYKKKDRELRRLKTSPKIFKALVSNQPRFFREPVGQGIWLGNTQAAVTITKVCNPFCGPCAQAHEMLEAVIHENSQVKLQVIFLVPNGNDTRSLVVKHFLALQETGDINQVKRAMDSWYGPDGKSYETLAAAFPVNEIMLEKQGRHLDEMYDWCKEQEIQFTPTLFINGYQLPEIYQPGDLKYFLR